MFRLLIALTLCLTALLPTEVAGHGMVVTSPSLVATARSKIRARPDFFSIAGFVTINEKHETVLAGAFDYMSEACGRGAEVHQRIEKRLGKKETPSPASAAKLYAAFNNKLKGLCVDVLDFFFVPWPQVAPGVLAGWAANLKKVIGLDYKIYMSVAPLSDTNPNLLKFGEAAKVLEHVDGMGIYLQDYHPDTAADYRALVAKNVEWASAQALKTGKKIVVYIPSFQDWGWGNVPAHRNITEAMKGVLSVKKEHAQAFCNDSLRLGLITNRVDDPKQDREMLSFEKWRESMCPPPPDKP